MEEYVFEVYHEYDDYPNLILPQVNGHKKMRKTNINERENKNDKTDEEIHKGI